MVKAYTLKFNGKGIIESIVLKRPRKKGKAKSSDDIIHIKFRASDGEWLMNCDITPEEAVYLATALLCAYTRSDMNG